MLDMNDAELPRNTDILPDGSFVKITMQIRRGGLDGDGEADRGVLKAAKSPGSDVRMLDCEFTITDGPLARRKFWQTFTVMGGKLDEHGVSIGWKISKGLFRAMIDSALGLDPQDMSDAARGKRVLRGLSDLHGITFAAKLRVEPASDARYSETNKIDRVLLMSDPEYAKVMAGESVPAAPTPRAPRAAANAPASAAPAWGTQPAPVPAAAPEQTPAWSAPAQPAPTAQPAPPPAASPAFANGGPAWLNG
jgi:hypothetical protein